MTKLGTVSAATRRRTGYDPAADALARQQASFLRRRLADAIERGDDQTATPLRRQLDAVLNQKRVSMSRLDIEIVRLRRLDRGQVRAVATVKVGPVTIADVSVLQQPGGRPWLGLPQAPVRRSSGAGWTAIIRIDDPAVLADLENAVISAWASAS